ncbi:MAG: hypothetical protein KME08_06715 [Aphanothece sp. CMT-3BRIN-NPC111]|nr:hypothetical protein [Aphanothece sp. CMT-3BRIN-NPC111]
MKTHKLIYLLAGVLVLGASIPSNAQPQNNSLVAKPTASAVSNQTKTQRPPTKTATISVEGEKTEVTLKLYEHSSPQFSTYFVENYFLPESVSSDEGTGVRFFVNTGGIKKEDAYVHFFFPARATSLGNLKKFVNGRRGLLATNGWQVVNRTRNVPYRWAKERIGFQQRQGNETILGHVYLGEYKGKAFYAIAHYPAEYGDGFGPRANLIFQNLQFKG